MSLHRRACLRAAAVAPALGVLAGLGGLGGCASLAAPMSDALRRAPPTGLPRRVALDVPFVAQDDELCGPATLAMLLGAAGLPGDLATLTPQVYLPGRQGSLQIEMLAATRRHGALAFTLPPRLEALCAELAAGRPVGLLLNLALPVLPRWHYAVLTGYDLDACTARLHSGRQGAQGWPLATLEHTWTRAGAWALVALPPGRWPVAATADTAVAAVAAFERGAGAGAPGPGLAWRSATQRWPQSLGPVLGLANWHLSRDELADAAALLERATGQHDSAVAWNNLAVVQARQGRRAAARASIEQAERRAREAEPRWLPEIAATRREWQL
ncbi:PA2778 family cysteine peptidase [Ideonella sp.]|uniref:PA2778 family cysteine peptidase n=1 Tax=Ideonella sp. TaxID=1929293 RepID=UPI0035B301A0